MGRHVAALPVQTHFTFSVAASPIAQNLPPSQVSPKSLAEPITPPALAPPVQPPPQTASAENAINTAASDDESWFNRKSAYYPISEVDRTAEPVGEWVINSSIWPLGNQYTLVVDLWISATGVLDHWAVVTSEGGYSQQDAAQAKEAAQTILLDLHKTPINPALRDGRPVASYRRIALDIERTFP